MAAALQHCCDLAPVLAAHSALSPLLHRFHHYQDMIRARLLVNQLQVYYCGDDEQSQSVLRDFHNA